MNLDVKLLYITDENMLDQYLDQIKIILDQNKMEIITPINLSKYFVDIVINEKTGEVISVIMIEKRFPVNLHKFAIKQNYQGKGLGKQIFKLWEEDFNDLMLKNDVFHYTVHLECDDKTIDFYKKQNYEQYGGYKRKDTKTGEFLDRIFMKKNIILKN